MILAIDFGSTSFKAGIFDRRLRQVWARSVPVQYRYGSGGRVELVNVEATVRQLLPRRHDYGAVAITSQAQTFTVVDRAGKARRPFVSWQDRRAGQACERLKRQWPDFAEHSSFADLLPALQVCQIEHAPVGCGEIPLLLPSYFVRKWTGESVTDENLAAMSGLYSVAKRDWLAKMALPRVVPVGTVGAVTAMNSFGLPAGVPVVLAGNDQTAGAYAARLEENGATLVTLGTAQVVYRCVARMPAAASGLIRGPYPGGKFYRMGADAWGGNLVNWAKALLARCGTDAAFFAQAGRAEAGCQGLVFDADRGEWQGLAMHHTSAEMARSILEELSRRLAELIERLGTRRNERLLVAGGGSTQPLWRRIAAEALRGRLVATDASPLMGAARMAARALHPGGAIPRNDTGHRAPQRPALRSNQSYE